MSVTIVLGSQFGDEGKGKLVDSLLASSSFKLVARCCGGHNAGHTLVVDGVKFDFHILPSGLVAPGAVNLVGNGTVVHVPQFFKELKDIQAKGVNTEGRIYVSDRAHVLFKLHKAADGLREKALKDQKIGTTGNGIGPSYGDKSTRSGVRVADIFDKANFDQRLRALETKYRSEFGDTLDYDLEAEIKEFDEYRKTMKPFVVDSIDVVSNLQDSGEQILVEAANAIMLDIDMGTFPYVTSSSTGIAGVLSGLAGIRPESLSRRIGVVKAYTTRVGSGPLPTEDFGEGGQQLQEIGQEFGTTTGRRRRCGWLDLPLLRYSNAVNRYTELNLTKLDVLDSFSTLKVAMAYHCKTEDGSTRTWTNRYPADLRQLEPKNCEVEYVELEGWKTDITKCRSWSELPQKAKEYVSFIEKEVGVPIKWIGVGPGREAMIEKS